MRGPQRCAATWCCTTASQAAAWHGSCCCSWLFPAGAAGGGGQQVPARGRKPYTPARAPGHVPTSNAVDWASTPHARPKDSQQRQLNCGVKEERGSECCCATVNGQVWPSRNREPGPTAAGFGQVGRRKRHARGCLLLLVGTPHKGLGVCKPRARGAARGPSGGVHCGVANDANETEMIPG